ncbi:MAG: hypothetical protein H0W03_02180 [Solirubrobacterales bacterium]|nr:hypothetical protein [Solirubrobacterales bacterium]
MTAVHASRPDLVLSHPDAAALLGLRPDGSMYAIVLSGSRRRRLGHYRWPSLEATGAYAVGILALGPLALGCAALSLRWRPGT